MSESNTRPLGYEPSALPLRQSAMKENVSLALYLGCDLLEKVTRYGYPPFVTFLYLRFTCCSTTEARRVAFRPHYAYSPVYTRIVECDRFGRTTYYLHAFRLEAASVKKPRRVKHSLL